MADPRFYKKKGPFTLGELATLGQCEIGRGDPSLLIEDIAPLDVAQPSFISLFYTTKYLDSANNTKASACIVSKEVADKAPAHLALLVAPYPNRSYALIANAFYPKERKKGHIDPTASIHPSVKLGKEVVIGPFAVLEAHVEIGDFAEVGPHAVIGEGVVIGEGTIIGSQATVSHALIGKHVHIKPGARIGQSGFGFFMDQGDMGGHVPITQLGRVIIQDYVEIGSNTTVDRGSGADTVIGLGTRIDNLVQIAHNVQFGKGCVMVAQSGVAGSTQFGDYVAAGGQVGIIDNLKIGTGARLAAQCGIQRDVAAGEILVGSPAMPLKAFYRQVAVLKKLEEQTRKKIN
jgi:UDP-3-O-[3-hydroxymyristoyl] glucosamine N-acyltransferase